MRTIGDRPVLLQRFPEGAGGSSCFQKRVPKSAPPWLTTTIVSTPKGTTSDALAAADPAHLLRAVKQGCLGLHARTNSDRTTVVQGKSVYVRLELARRRIIDKKITNRIKPKKH